MRHVYALLGLCKRYGDERVEQACGLALEAEMFDVHRLERMLQLARPATTVEAPQDAKVIPLARYLRPAEQYKLPLPSQRRNDHKEDSDD